MQSVVDEKRPGSENINVPTNWKIIRAIGGDKVTPELKKAAIANVYIMVTGYTANSFKPGDVLQFNFEGWRSGAGTICPTIWMYASSSVGAACSGGVTVSVSNGGSYASYTTELTIPSNWTGSNFSFYVLGFQVDSNADYAVRNVRIFKKTAGQLIVDGTITATQIAAGAITAAQIATDTITATQIATNAITASELAANAVTADKISANAVTAVKIAAGTITAAQIATNTITANNIATGTITATQLAANAITADKIAANAVTTDKIVANAITTAKIAAGAITATQIAADTITANNIAANAITASELATNAVTADKIAANTITAAKIAANTITAAQIAANTITATQIATGTITATQIATGTITSNQIAANAITTTQLAANAVTAAKIAANTITATQIAAGTITSNQIAANTITADKVLIGSTGNMLPDPQFTNFSGIQWNGQSRDTSFTRVAGVPTLKIAAGTNQRGAYYGLPDGNGNTPAPSGRAGGAYRAGVWVYSDAAIPASGLGIYVREIVPKSNGSTAKFCPGTAIRNSAIAAKTWFYLTGDFTVDATGFSDTPTLALGLFAESTATGNIWWSEPTMIQKTNGQLIVDGTITAAKIAANTITATQIAADTITVDKLSVSNLAAITANLGTITAGNIDASKVTVSNISAANITTGTLNAARIAASSITVDKLNVSNLAAISANLGTITAGNIDAAKVTIINLNASNISTGTLAASRISAGTLSAISANLGNVVSGSITNTFTNVSDSDGKTYSGTQTINSDSVSINWKDNKGVSGSTVVSPRGFRVTATDASHLIALDRYGFYGAFDFDWVTISTGVSVKRKIDTVTVRVAGVVVKSSDHALGTVPTLAKPTATGKTMFPITAWTADANAMGKTGALQLDADGTLHIINGILGEDYWCTVLYDI